MSLLLLSTKLVLLSSNTPPPFAKQLHQLHAHAVTLARYDPSWAIRDRNRLFANLLKQAGIVSDDVNTAKQDDMEAEEAFSQGDQVANGQINGVRTVSASAGASVGSDPIDQLGQRLKHVLLAGSTSATRQRLPHKAQNDLACWPVLPDWADKPSPTHLRDPAADVDQSPVTGSAMGFGNAHFKASTSRRGVDRPSGRGQKGRPEKVVLVPTESDASVYAKAEVPRSRGLQEFLESDEDDDRGQTTAGGAIGQSMEASSTEEEEESEEESEEDSSADSSDDEQTSLRPDAG